MLKITEVAINNGQTKNIGHMIQNEHK